MKETKVYVVKHPQGAYEDYQEPIVKVFLNEKEAKSYVKEENAKLPLEQAKKCDECYFKWTCVGQKGKKIPSCFNGNKYNYCENYFKYHDIQELFIEEHEIDDIKIHDREKDKRIKGLEQKVQELQEIDNKRAFRLYAVLYDVLEKQDSENVASRIDYLTGKDYSEMCELYKTAKNLKQHDRELVKEVCGKIRSELEKELKYDFTSYVPIMNVCNKINRVLDQIQKEFEK